MTLPSSGAISAYDINIEMGRSPTESLPFGSDIARDVAGIGPSLTSTISLSNFHGKSGPVVSIVYTQSWESVGFYHSGYAQYYYGSILHALGRYTTGNVYWQFDPSLPAHLNRYSFIFNIMLGGSGSFYEDATTTGSVRLAWKFSGAWNYGYNNYSSSNGLYFRQTSASGEFDYWNARPGQWFTVKLSKNPIYDYY